MKYLGSLASVLLQFKCPVHCSSSRSVSPSPPSVWASIGYSQPVSISHNHQTSSSEPEPEAAQNSRLPCNYLPHFPPRLISFSFYLYEPINVNVFSFSSFNHHQKYLVPAAGVCLNFDILIHYYYSAKLL